MPQRNQAVDVYRGFVMLLMMAEVLQLSRLGHAFPGNWFLNALAWNQTHVEWAGCSLHDTIQPGFSFLVGVALPYSIASRLAKGGTFRTMFLHCLWRSFVLIALGIFLRSMHSPQTYFTFEDTLAQIGLGLSVLVFARISSAEVAVDYARRDFVQLLAGMGSLSVHWPGRLHRVHGAIGIRNSTSGMRSISGGS